MTRRHSALALATVSSLVATCGQPPGLTVNPERAQQVPGFFYSQHIADNYKIFVAVPDSYDAEPERRFPVVYLLDGDWYFSGGNQRLGQGGVRGMIRRSSEAGRMPPAVLVAVGYPDDNQRGRDFVVEPADFLAFLREELIPAVDSRYRTLGSSDRTLLGHSDGGFFVLYALLQYASPAGTPFRRFVSLSGDFGKDYGIDMWAEEAMLATSLDEGQAVAATLFLAAGGKEEARFVSSHLEMLERLSSRAYPGLRVRGRLYAGLDHGGVVEPAFREGLEWSFAPERASHGASS